MENRLTVEMLYGMIVTGARQVIINEAELNQLNVFPVADRDTGTNLASMMRYIADNLSLTKDHQELLHQLSQHGLVGCSGNSGLIFSQFFYGLAQHPVTSRTFVKLHDFANMIMNGYKAAYESVSQPKPGTILTAMEKWVQSYKELITNTKESFCEIFQKSVEKTREAVKDTINQLEVLRQNNVVDAGAQGFLHFLEGMLLFLKSDIAVRKQILNSNVVSETKFETEHQFESLTEYPEKRYCFELVLRVGSNKEESILEKERHYLETLGDSMVIGHASQMEKLHIHTDNPKQITQYLANYGSVLYQKIDDMLMQYNVTNKPNNEIAIVVDSMADLPKEWAEQNNIFTFPLQVKVNNHSFLDKFTVGFRDVVNYLADPKYKVGTAAPSTSVVSRGLHFLSQHYKSIIVLSVAKAISSTHDIIANQANKLKDYKITTIDSCTNSVTMGLLAIMANKLIESKNYTHDEIVNKINRVKKNANFLVFINSLNELVKSGRLSKPAGFFAKLLRVKPIVKMDNKGKPKIIGIAFTRAQGWKKMLKHLEELKQSGKLGTYAIAHSTDDKSATAFKRYIEGGLNMQALYMADGSGVSVAHSGGNGFSVGYVSETVSI